MGFGGDAYADALSTVGLRLFAMLEVVFDDGCLGFLCANELWMRFRFVGDVVDCVKWD